MPLYEHRDQLSISVRTEIRGHQCRFVDSCRCQQIRRYGTHLSTQLIYILTDFTAFYYREKGIWYAFSQALLRRSNKSLNRALIMAQTMINLYAADQIFNLVTRLIGTFLGLVMGLLVWYLGMWRPSSGVKAHVIEYQETQRVLGVHMALPRLWRCSFLLLFLFVSFLRFNMFKVSFWDACVLMVLFRNVR